MNVGHYAKGISAAVVAGLTAAVTALQDDKITPVEWVGIASATVAALAAVVAASPYAAGRYLKSIMSGVVAGLASLAIALTDGGGITAQEWLNIALAAAAGAGLVAVVPNAARSDAYRDDAHVVGA